MLIRLMKLDTTSARRSYRIWSYTNDNESRLFKRIIDICNQFSTYFLDEKLSQILMTNLRWTDFQELLLSLKWLSVLWDNNKLWQDNLKKQDYSFQNNNIILAVIEWMRASVLRINHEYVLDLLRAIVKFMISSINGRNEALSNQYANSNVIQYWMIILKSGLSPQEAEIFKGKGWKSLKFWKRIIKVPKEQRVIIMKKSQKYNLLKQEVLSLINCLLLPSTIYQIKKQWKLWDY